MKAVDSLLDARAKQLGLPLATFANQILKPDSTQELHTLVPADFARKHRALPLFVEGDLLAVAFAAPEEATIEAMKLFTRCTIQPFLAKPDELETALDRFYR